MILQNKWMKGDKVKEKLPLSPLKFSPMVHERQGTRHVCNHGNQQHEDTRQQQDENIKIQSLS